MVKVGIIGLGYWGPNLERNISNLNDSKLVAVCDLIDDRLEYVRKQSPGIYATKNADDILNKDLIDAVVIATPTRTHYELTRQALEHGIHVLVEKPLATTSCDCEDLIELAEANELILFVGHVFLYNSAVKKLKELIDRGKLGNIIHITANRLNLGPVRSDVNVLWDLAPHDISIILELIGRMPVSVNCQGLTYLKNNVHDVCTLTMHFQPKTMASVYVSWLDPNKVRTMTVVGEKMMVVFDDNEPLEKLRIYNKRVKAVGRSDTFSEFQNSYRYGDTNSPWVKLVEPLKKECQEFLHCVKNEEQPKTDGYNGLDVVRVLEAADYSLRHHGQIVKLAYNRKSKPSQLKPSFKPSIKREDILDESAIR
ncbi:Gfo/Idh/MocA family protein [Acidobacteriota bacterium]